MITRTERRIDMSRPGFSLIEITAVILLIGILAAGAAIAILPQRVATAAQPDRRADQGHCPNGGSRVHQLLGCLCRSAFS